MFIHPHTSLTFEQCQKARVSRDSRFDGRFYVAVKTTGIFCRPICPANLPKEENVEYFTDKAKLLKRVIVLVCVVAQTARRDRGHGKA